MTAAGLPRLWFGLHAPVSRTAYALSGFGLMGLKYAVETVAVHHVTGQWLTPFDYFNPLLATRQAAVGGHTWLLYALVVWTLPFLWIGVSMTLRRAEDAGLPPFVVLLYFVPYLNYLGMLALCLAPPQPALAEQIRRLDVADGHPLRSALAGVAAGALIALAMVGVSVLAFGAYGTTLFFATPFVMGTAAAYVFNRPAPKPKGASLAVAALSVCAAGAAIMLFALEGIVCLFMAAPLALGMALMGGLLGRDLARRPDAPTLGLTAFILPLPLCAGLEGGRPAPAAHHVVTVVEVAAPPEVVWRHVVSFSELREPPAWFFRLGIAYPRRATIDGRGVGALRRCEFSTGAFLEPITVWDEPRRLSFDVAAQPPPLTEWSPYRHVAAPHLDGYLRVRDGEFLLQPLAGGRTRLVGRTSYEMRVFPSAYWRLWSDALVEAIHRRVLHHVKALSERRTTMPQA